MCDLLQVAFEEDVRICNEKLIRNCDRPGEMIINSWPFFFRIGKPDADILSGPEVCETVYESECETSYHEHEVEEDTPSCRIMQVTNVLISKSFLTVFFLFLIEILGNNIPRLFGVASSRYIYPALMSICYCLLANTSIDRKCQKLDPNYPVAINQTRGELKSINEYFPPSFRSRSAAT